MCTAVSLELYSQADNASIASAVGAGAGAAAAADGAGAPASMSPSPPLSAAHSPPPPSVDAAADGRAPLRRLRRMLRLRDPSPRAAAMRKKKLGCE